MYRVYNKWIIFKKKITPQDPVYSWVHKIITGLNWFESKLATPTCTRVPANTVIMCMFVYVFVLPGNSCTAIVVGQ